jgi:hypothetical protein
MGVRRLEGHRRFHVVRRRTRSPHPRRAQVDVQGGQRRAHGAREGATRCCGIKACRPVSSRRRVLVPTHRYPHASLPNPVRWRVSYPLPQGFGCSKCCMTTGSTRWCATGAARSHPPLTTRQQAAAAPRPSCCGWRPRGSCCCPPLPPPSPALALRSATRPCRLSFQHPPLTRCCC